jgi:hypothetical protein
MSAQAEQIKEMVDELLALVGGGSKVDIRSPRAA